MEQNKQKNSRKRLNSLILLVAFTAVMLIVSTYAWFSTQKNVTLKGIEGKVSVAEGLQISLDASVWKNEINFAEFTDGGNSTSATYFAAEGATLADPLATGTASNIIPSELLPASTVGEIEATNEKTLVFYRGENEDGNKLESIGAVTEDADAGFYAIDLYLQNSSAGSTPDLLQLEPNSLISIATNKAETGLQNSLRVALAITETEVAVDGVNGQSTILSNAAQKKISKVTIWEPNADMHSTFVQNNQKVYYTEGTATAIEAHTQHNTWCVTKDNTGTINNVYYWNTANTGLAESHTVQTTGQSALTATTPFLPATDGSTQITIAANTYVKARLYIWLEGQDVDCINQASYGGKVTIDFGFSKPGSNSSNSTSVSDSDSESV